MERRGRAHAGAEVTDPFLARAVDVRGRPVLLDEVLEQLRLKPGMVVADGTLGAAGHTSAIADLVEPDLMNQLMSLPENEQYSFVFRGNAQAKSLDFDVDESADIVRTDRKLLAKALRSLVANAIRYTEEGQVSIRCLRVSDGVRVTVADTGIGIAEKNLELIFDQFRQVDGSYSREHEGTGLGLAISQKLAQLIDGEINVRSTLGHGSVFTLRLRTMVPANNS